MFRFLPESLKDRIRLRAGAITPASRLRNLRRAGFEPSHILDGGAYDGEWARMARRTWPLARLLHEVIAACVARGYRPYDLWGHNHRPLDGALWQTDVLFVRQDSRLLARRDYA